MRWVQLNRPSNKQQKKSSVFRLDLKVAEVLADLVRADSEFQSLGAAAEKARAAKTVLTGGSCSRGALDERRLLID